MLEKYRGKRRFDPTSLRPINLATIPGARPAPFPSFVAPMLATLTTGPFANPAWIFEPKLDGYRFIALVQNRNVRLLSRRGLDNTTKYAHLAESLRHQKAGELILDGEVVALDELGRPCFQCLQQRLMLEREAQLPGEKEAIPIIYYVFDIVYVDGYDLTRVPLRQRKDILYTSVKSSNGLRLLDYFEGDGELVYEAAVRQGFEGVVAKLWDSVYEPGRRSRSWLKVKVILSDEFVIGGFSHGLGARWQTLGALLLGQYDDRGRLVYTGHVGTGFAEQMLVDLKHTLDAIKTDSCPFAETPPLNAPTTWVKPELVAEVKFSEWTQDGRLRTPVFLRLREDKPAREIWRVQTEPTPKQLMEAGSPAAAKPRKAFAYPSFPKGEESLLHQLQKTGDSFSIHLRGHEISLNNLDKELWPAFEGQPTLNKRDLLIYLARVSPYLLPHLRDRPITLKRYPDGIYGEYFYQKHWPFPLPDFVETIDIPSETDQPYLLCNNLPSLLWLGQLADVELHTWFSRISRDPELASTRRRRRDPTGPDLLGPVGQVPTRRQEDRASILDYPDFIIFDLDPYIYAGTEAAGAEPALSLGAFARTCQAALWLKELLDSLSLLSFVKTSGRTGLHVYVPIVRRFDYHQVHAAAETVGRFLWQQHPREITLDWAVEKRTGMVFIDYNQNVYGKTLASVYSPRATPQATISMPVSWDELNTIYPTDFTIFTVPDRLAKIGDMWSGILDARRDLSQILKGK